MTLTKNQTKEAAMLLDPDDRQSLAEDLLIVAFMNLSQKPDYWRGRD